MTFGVVGGGIAGLTAAFFLTQAGHRATVLEASPASGGVVATERRDGFVLEHGAGSLRGSTRAVYDLVFGLGLASATVGASPAAATRYLVQGGRLVALPSSPSGLLRSPILGRRAAARLLLEPFVPPRWRDDDEETVHALLARRVGRRAADVLANPLVAGIFAGDPHHLEAASAFPRWKGWERRRGSLLLGALGDRVTPPTGMPRGIMALTGGTATLVEALVERLDVRCSCAVEAVLPDADGVVVTTSEGERRFDRVVVTAPLGAKALPWVPATHLPPVPTVGVASVHLGLLRDLGLAGFGWLCHAHERRDVLGALWVSSAFPGHAPPGATLVRVMLGGARDPGLAARPDDELVAVARGALAEVQGVQGEPDLVAVSRAHIPQYPPGFARRMATVRAGDPRVSFVGWWWGHLGLAETAAAASRLPAS